eukprot:4616642-Prymnesium_polylepis.1
MRATREYANASAATRHIYLRATTAAAIDLDSVVVHRSKKPPAALAAAKPLRAGGSTVCGWVDGSADGGGVGGGSASAARLVASHSVRAEGESAAAPSTPTPSITERIGPSTDA